jgi:anti-sigma B factor antagonist
MAETGTTFEFVQFDFDGARVVRAVGEFGLESADRFQATIDAAVAAGSPVIIDLSDVEFMDSTGLSVIVNSLKDSWGHGHALLVAGPLRAPVASLLNITGLSRYLIVHPSWNAAVEALQR